ncbi:MAG: EMC3/TMCO1 family protein [Candidatus Aenigmarchaeota archaeon]|nr:EMC3/TMCO1 family protein [Candidatus Aenigmarchaeota archaeon]
MMETSPILMIFFIGAGISIFSSLINKKVLGTEKARETKKRMQDVRSEMLEAQKSGDKKRMNECLTELMKINSEYMRLSLKPMVISLILVIIILLFLRNTYTGMVVATIPNTLPVVGGIKLDWFWWYFISTLIVSMTVKKILGI